MLGEVGEDASGAVFQKLGKILCGKHLKYLQTFRGGNNIS